ncbi:MAG: tetratricopeptide repeat protein [Deltaproteobacteria bacterium]
MQTLYIRPLPNVELSIVLLDWSCRESFHIFDDLDQQTIARDRYELIWLEYFSRRPNEITLRIEHGTASPDVWGVMEMPEDAYYHKHFIYNAGILLARGRIVVICDSDAMVNSTFVESILAAFELDEKIVLHLDEVRNVDRRHYPFDHPTVAEFLDGACKNWQSGMTSGLLNDIDVIHSRNYGACFCALKEDLIAIGGADEHIDYLGHVCGPYDLTFRLVNHGRREIWLKEEFLYHTWHPGAGGRNNYIGPHDGRYMSSRALNARFTGRVMPYLENPAIACYRDTGDLERSLAVLATAGGRRTAVDWRIDNENRFLSLGREAWYQKKFSSAVNYWERLAAVPEMRTSEVLGWLGWGRAGQRRFRKSVALFEEALRLDASNSWARCGLGRALSSLGRDEEALDCFESILDKAPEDYLAYRYALEERGKLLFRRSSFAAALDDFKSLCELHELYEKKSRCRMACFRVGLCEMRLGNSEAAIAAFGKAGGNIAGNPHLSTLYLTVWYLLHGAAVRTLNLLRQVKRAATEFRGT